MLGRSAASRAAEAAARSAADELDALLGGGGGGGAGARRGEIERRPAPREPRGGARGGEGEDLPSAGAAIARRAWARWQGADGDGDGDDADGDGDSGSGGERVRKEASEGRAAGAGAPLRPLGSAFSAIDRDRPHQGARRRAAHVPDGAAKAGDAEATHRSLDELYAQLRAFRARDAERITRRALRSQTGDAGGSSARVAARFARVMAVRSSAEVERDEAEARERAAAARRQAAWRERRAREEVAVSVEREAEGSSGLVREYLRWRTLGVVFTRWAEAAARPGSEEAVHEGDPPTQ
eukprot:PRCOL_00006373-RA